MTVDAISNLAYSSVATAPSPELSGTSLILETGDGAKFPAVPFDATAWPSDEIPTTANAEIVRVTALNGDTVTMTRAQYGTTAQSITEGFQFAQSITANLISEINTAISAAQSAAETYALAQAQAMWPIGSVFISTVDTNPATLLGFGTWSAFAQGEVLIGVGTGTDQNGVQATITNGQTLGEYVHTLSSSESGTPGATTGTESAGHVHYDSGHYHSDAGHAHGPENGTVIFSDFSATTIGYGGGATAFAGNPKTAAAAAAITIGYASLGGESAGHTHSFNAANAASAHNVVQPSVGVYIWNRTA